ncbi:13855_t:CDS:2 [Gigaspora rosea]|nr:13855_t:CDS:2 [Gigaspora rosea]
MGPVQGSNEAVRSDFVSVVLSTIVSLVDRLRMFLQFEITGVESNGRVDYAIKKVEKRDQARSAWYRHCTKYNAMPKRMRYKPTSADEKRRGGGNTNTFTGSPLRKPSEWNSVFRHIKRRQHVTKRGKASPRNRRGGYNEVAFQTAVELLLPKKHWCSELRLVIDSSNIFVNGVNRNGLNM